MIDAAHDRVIVRPHEASDMSTGEHADGDGDAVALHIPEKARETPRMGDVLGVGPDVTSCRVGDSVLYGRYTGDEVPYEGEDLLWIRDGDIMGVNKGEAWKAIEQKHTAMHAATSP